MPTKDIDEDIRAPSYLGFWRRSVPTSFKGFLENNPTKVSFYLEDEKSRISMPPTEIVPKSDEKFINDSLSKNDEKSRALRKHRSCNVPLVLDSSLDKTSPSIDETFRFSGSPALDQYDEPHFKRRLEILSKYPEISRLYGTERSSVYVLLVILAVQLLMLKSFTINGFLYDYPVWLMVVLSYVVGGTCTKLGGILLHEATHNLVFSNGNMNIAFGFAVNLLIFVPVGYAFRRYHLLHHQFQGIPGRDPDLPFSMEYRLISGNFISKLFWISLYPFMYPLRTFALHLLPTRLEILNWFLCVIWDSLLLMKFGSYPFLYFMLSLYFGNSLHPAAAHFIQEHYTWNSGQETYSYYGPLNKIFLNIGYHNEHHDFTKVPWTRLPLIYEGAKEYYSCLKHHDSWLRVFWEFLTDRTLAPSSRLTRTFETHERGRKLLTK